MFVNYMQILYSLIMVNGQRHTQSSNNKITINRSIIVIIIIKLIDLSVALLICWHGTFDILCGVALRKN